ncbi:MAG: copper homeostasis protein CutC [Balneolaceae bacterium]|nr:copper homeostasis protein CutC [Balneolaceae bacterium]
MQQPHTIEICIDSPEAAFLASQHGAHRLEVCSALAEGGLTPSYGFLHHLKEQLTAELAVLIRPRSGDFLYNRHEYEVMKKDIRFCKSIGVHAVVFGILKQDGTVDLERNNELVELAKPIDAVFHRAFDVARDPFEALNSCIKAGFSRILTSGQHNKAFDGITLIEQLIQQAEDRISIMPGSGISPSNIQRFIDIGAGEFHMSLKTTRESNMEYRKSGVSMGASSPDQEYQLNSVDLKKLEQIISIVDKNKT